MERDDLCGRTLGEFVLRERIGEGGFGAVYRCQQPLLGRQAVIKVLHQRLRDNEIELQRFTREAQLASRLDHPYAAHVYAFGVEQDDGLFWIAMEMVQGTTLDRWLRDRGPLPVDQLVPFFERVAEVVETAHERGIVHRDLKPSNIMVIERAGRLLPKLLDFGIAKMQIAEHVPVAPTLPAVVPDAVTPRQLDIDTMPLGAGDGVAGAIHSPLTRADAAMGSPPYMSPEQWRDALAVTPRSDLYSLGIVAYESLTGRRPFVATTGVAYAELHSSAAVPATGLSASIDRFFVRALAKQPEDRPASALALAAELRVAAGLGTTVVDLPKLDDDVRATWIADAPQPLAEAVAAVEGARNAHQARDAALDLVRGLVRYVLAVALAARAQVRDDRDSPALLDALRAARRHDLDDDDRIKLIRLLARPFTSRRGAHPVPELVDLVTPDNGNDAFDPILDARPTGGSEDVVLAQLAQLVPVVTRLLRACRFVVDYVLAVPRDGLAERWTGLRRPRRVIATVNRGELVDAHPVLLDRDGRAVVELWPLVQTVAPAAGAELELFVFDGPGRHGARLVAGGLQHHDATVWDWFGTEVIGDDTAESAASDERPPYLGLASFSSSDADRFVGRERETDACVNRLRRQALLVVVGASGAGKSSFVHAGLVPALPTGWRVVTMRPGPTPMATLAARLAAANITSTDLHAVLADAPAAAAALVAHAAADGTIVVVVDQLEEMFTLCADAGERLRFATVLSHLAASAEAPVRVIATIRDDFLMQLEALAPLRALISPALMLLGNPSRDDLIRTVVEPAARLGYEPSDPELVPDMVDEVAERPGALSLLSFTASRLWELRDRRFHQLTRNAYDAMGGVGGALGRHAEDVLATLSADERRLAPDVFRNLVTADRTRAVLGLGELRERLASPRADEVIDKLVAARLLEVAELDGKPNIEIIHEALIAAWPRLQRWIASDAEAARMREQLGTTAKQWHERGRPRGLLWRDDVLVELERWRRRGAVALSDVEMAFADASRSAAARGRRVRRGVLASSFVVLAATAVVMIYLRAQAAEQSEFATEQSTRATDLLFNSYEELGQQALIASDPDTALAYLGEALRIGDTRPGVRFMLARALEPLRAQIALLRGHTGQIRSIAYNADGTRIVTAGTDGTVRVWDARDGSPLFVLSGHSGSTVAAWSPDGDDLVTGDGAGQIRFWTREGTLAGRVLRSPAAVTRIAFGSHGRLATASRVDGWISIWDVDTRTLRSSWHADAAVFDASFDPRGETLVTAGANKVAEIWSPDGRSIAKLAGHTELILVARFSPSGDRVATASFDGTARVWRIAGGKALVLRGHDGRVTDVAWDPSGRFVATAGLDRTARVWNATTGELVATMHGHTAQLNRVIFTPDGLHVVTAAGDGTTRVWEPATGLQVAMFLHPGFLASEAIDVSGVHLATASWSGVAAIWRLDDQPHLTTLLATSEPVAMRLVTGRALLVTAHELTVWDDPRRKPRRFASASTLVAGDISTTGLLAVAGDDHGAIQIFANHTLSVQAHEGPVLRVAISPAVDRIASWGSDEMIDLRDSRGTPIAHRTVAVVSAANPAKLVLAYSPNGDRLVAFDMANSDATLLGPNLELVAKLGVQATSAAFATDGLLAVGGKDEVVRIVDRGGALVRSLPSCHFEIAIVAWSPSTAYLAIGGLEGSLQVWNTRGWQLVAQRKADDSYVAAIAFTRDERFFATGGGTHEIKLWESRTALQVGSLPADDEIEALYFDDKARLFQTGQGGQRAHVWNTLDVYDGSVVELERRMKCRTTKRIAEGRLVVHLPCD